MSNIADDKKLPPLKQESPPTRRWQNQYIELARSLPEYLLSYEAAPPKEALATVLQKTAHHSEVYLDIGTGSGNFVLDSSKQDPKGFYLGVELRFKRAFRAAEKAQQAGLLNVFFFRAKAQDLIAALGDQSLSGVYVNFPDPWSKKKWEKHKLLKLDFLKEIARVLKTDGFFRYVTDHRGYFDQICEIIPQVSAFRIEHIKRDQPFKTRDLACPSTEFGQLFESKNMLFHELLVKKIP